MHQAGILDYAIRKSKRNKNPCSIREKNNKGNEQNIDDMLLKLPDFVGAFFILGVGLAFATITFVGEFLAKKILF